MNAIELSVFASRVAAVCDEMGAVLRFAAFSPNIKDRLDFSCAVFDATGELCAQAAHIPVHLGSMAYAMRDLVDAQDWQPGDMLIVNDPYLGGTHLPDVTLVAPVFFEGALVGFVANRAHHADIGATTPGSMPISSRLDEEGIVIPPSLLCRRGEIDESFFKRITQSTRNEKESAGDYRAQIYSAKRGVERFEQLISEYGTVPFAENLAALNDYAEKLVEPVLHAIPDGEYQFKDVMDDDGQGNVDLLICLRLKVKNGFVEADFAGSADQVHGNINCPESVVAAAVFYVFRCLMPAQTPACAGAFRRIALHVPHGSLLNAKRPAAVAAGNVETSTRVVDVVLGALAQAIPEQIPAASHGSMNNVAMGGMHNGEAWDYYETIGGGMGAGANHTGLDSVQTHMTNTLNTPIEVLESKFPLVLEQYAVRADSGGEGEHDGGDGIVRQYRFTQATTVTLLTERRRHAPWAIGNATPGKPGENFFNQKAVAGKCTFGAKPSDVLQINTPGGGGWSASSK